MFFADETFAREMDAQDPLRDFRDHFYLPLGKDGKPLIYFAGNSLGLMPKSVRQIAEEELDNWAKFGVDAHHAAGTPWYSYHEALREPVARLVGAQPIEVICMNSLTVNLHLMLATFYRPTKSRFKVLMEDPAFPSDTYAIKTQIAHHGHDSNGRHYRSYRKACRSSRARHVCRRKFFHRSIVRHCRDHSSSTQARYHRRIRSCARHRQCPALAARLECRFRCLVFIQISQRRTRRDRGRVRA